MRVLSHIFVVCPYTACSINKAFLTKSAEHDSKISIKFDITAVGYKLQCIALRPKVTNMVELKPGINFIDFHLLPIFG